MSGCSFVVGSVGQGDAGRVSSLKVTGLGLISHCLRLFLALRWVYIPMRGDERIEGIVRNRMPRMRGDERHPIEGYEAIALDAPHAWG